MKLLILQILLASSNCSKIEVNETISKRQFNLFQNITGINATAAQSVWQEVEQGIANVRHRRSGGSNVLPKFRLEITYVSKVVHLPPLTLRFKRQSTAPSIPYRGIKNISRKESFTILVLS